MPPPVGDQALATITDELANQRLDISEVLSAALAILSRIKAGTWVAAVMNEDPSTSRILTSDDSDPAMALYMDAYITSLDQPGRAPTSGLGGQVMAAGTPLMVPSMPIEKLFAITTPASREFFDRYPPPRALETVGLLIAPMRAGGMTLGTLALIDWNTRLKLNEADAEWLQVVADRVAAGVEHVQCHRAAIDRLQRLTAIRNIGLVVASSSDGALIMEIILEQVSRGLGVDAASILLVDEDQAELYSVASTGFRTGWELRLPIGNGIEPSRAGHTHDARSSPGWARQLQRRPGFMREGFQTWHAVSLLAHGRLVGLIEVFHRSTVEVDQEWLGFLDDVGTIAAIAIDGLATRELLRRVDKERGHLSLVPKPALSEVEWRILALVVDGATNREIARQVHLSESAIKFHVRKILDMVRAGNRTELARKVSQLGWL